MFFFYRQGNGSHNHASIDVNGVLLLLVEQAGIICRKFAKELITAISITQIVSTVFLNTVFYEMFPTLWCPNAVSSIFQ